MIRVVFAGPSLHGVETAGAADIVFRPPALCGDILKAVLDRANIIGLIDGVFETVPSVWHKEILFALSRGCRVFGAASLGALRAAECAAFGMTGIGAIYESYRSGARTADADVAVIHAPAEVGYAPLSLPMADLEDWLGDLSPDDGRAGLEILRAIHFRDRTPDAALAAVAHLPDVADRIAAYRPELGLKARDAQALLTAVMQAEPGGPRLAGFSHTGYFEVLARRVVKRSESGAAPLQPLSSH